MEVRPGYKLTDVGVIPEDWEVLPLVSIADRVMVGIASAATHAYRSKGIPMFRNQNIKAGRLDDSSLLFIDPAYEAVYRNKRLRAGDLLTARTGYPGTTCIVPEEYDSAQSFTTLISRLSSDKITGDFACCYINSEVGQKFFEQGQIGGAQKNVNVATLRKMPIPIPGLAEQLAIAKALSDVDALLNALDRLISKKRDLKQAAMQQLLTGKTRLPGFDEEWEVKRLGEIASIQRGASPRPIDSPIWFDQTSTTGWVRISDVAKCSMYLNATVQQLSLLGVKHSRLVAAGNLIMSICATVGRPVITRLNVCIHDGFVVFDDLKCDMQYAYHFLTWIEGNWAKHGQTGSQMNLNTALIKNTTLELPPLEEQAAISFLFTKMDAEISTLETHRLKTRHLKQGMMQELLTGRIRLVKSELRDV